MTAWEEIQQRSLKSGNTIEAICAADKELYARYCREQMTGFVAGTAKPHTPLMKASTASDLMLAFAKRKLQAGEVKTMAEGIEIVNHEHPSLYRDHLNALKGA